MSPTNASSPELLDSLTASSPGSEQTSEPALSELIVDATPAVAYPDRPWVVIAGVVGALALGTIVFTTMVSAQKRAGAGDVLPTRDAKNDGNLGQSIPEPPMLFAQAAPQPIAPPQPVVPENPIANEAVPPPQPWTPLPPPPPPVRDVYRPMPAAPPPRNRPLELEQI